MTYTIIGVIGHVNHGKTTLVRVLTGTDTDTLPEEKLRGITIDIGFASFTRGDHRFALIDAPGHQRYIGNLLVGVSSIDIGLLVVACDQGIQEQTLEHAAIIKAIGVSQLIVALTRTDLVDSQCIDTVSDEIELFLGDMGFNEIPIVPISSISGKGIARLVCLLCSYADQRAASGLQSVPVAETEFRMPIDRVFHVEGRGLVVAGTIWNGKVTIGDTLERAGTSDLFRVREIESHGARVESSYPGIRTAMNLVGSSATSISRGNELISPGYLTPAEQLIVDFEMFAGTKDVRCPCSVQMNTATQAVSVKLLAEGGLQSGCRSVVIVRPKQPVVARFLQPCLFRRDYPIGSFASGRILAGTDKRSFKRERLVELGKSLQHASPSERIVAWTAFKREMILDSRWCWTQLGIEADRLPGIVESLANKHLLRLENTLVSLQALGSAKQLILQTMEQRAGSAEHAWLAKTSLIEQCRAAGSARLLRWVLEDLITEGRLVSINGMVAIAHQQTAFTRKQRNTLEQIVSIYADNRSPPSLKELAAHLSISLDTATSLSRFAVHQRLLLDLGQGLLVSAQVFEVLLQELSTLLAQQPQVSVSTIRDFWGVTRKHAVPLLEYCDRLNLTVRHDNLRSAGTVLSLHHGELIEEP